MKAFCLLSAAGMLVLSAVSLAQSPLAKRADDAGNVLHAYGMDDAFFGSFVEDEPLDAVETAKLWKIVMRVHGLSLSELERWARGDGDWQILRKAPIGCRGEVFDIRGQATRVLNVPLDGDTKDRFGLSQLFEVEIRAPDGTNLVVYTTVVPSAWRLDGAIKESVSATSVFVKRARGENGDARLIFVAQRVAWHPNTLLGRLGMDEGLFDTVQNRKPLLASEHECFYQLLAAAACTKPHELEADAFAQLKRFAENSPAGEKRSIARARERRYDVVPLFNSPESQTGQLVMFEGDARRAVEIRLDDDDAKRFGISHYYEVALFTDDSQGNPIIFCVLELPKGMPLGEDILARVRIAGFFMKSWAYPQGSGGSKAGGKASEVKQQLAPLIIGRDTRLFVPTASAGELIIGTIVVGAIAVAMAAILLAAWRTGRPSRISHSAIPDAAAPDFSSLDR